MSDETINTKWVLGIAGTIIILLLGITGYFVKSGFEDTKATLCKVTENQVGLKVEFKDALTAMKVDMARMEQTLRDNHMLAYAPEHSNKKAAVAVGSGAAGMRPARAAK